MGLDVVGISIVKVGHRFVEKLVEFDNAKQYRIVTFCEEPRPAYDRVGLTSFFAHRNADELMLAQLDWYQDQGIELHIGDRATSIDREKNRKMFMKTILALIPWLLVFSPLDVIAGSKIRPNILLAISDDQSYPHTSAYGCKGISTPAFDEVAAAGMLFHLSLIHI